METTIFAKKILLISTHVFGQSCHISTKLEVPNLRVLNPSGKSHKRVSGRIQQDLFVCRIIQKYSEKTHVSVLSCPLSMRSLMDHNSIFKEPSLVLFNIRKHLC